MVRKVNVFVSYSHKDEALKSELDEHLSPLKQSDEIEYWHDRRINPGTDWAKEIDDNLNSADIILLLISASFINSKYCWRIELNLSNEDVKEIVESVLAAIEPPNRDRPIQQRQR